MTFLVTLLGRLESDRTVTLSAAASETYYATLQCYHGWIVTGTFNVALKLVPSRESFFQTLGMDPAPDADLGAMRRYCDAFDALLRSVHAFLKEQGQDDPSRV